MSQINWTVLEVSLHAVIEKWIEEANGNDEWKIVGYVGDNLASHMAIAALAVLKSSADVQTYLEREGMINEQVSP